MIIKIEKYVIIVDDGRSYRLCVLTPTAKNPAGMRTLGFFHDFGYLVADLIKRLASDTPGVKTLEEVRDKIERIGHELSVAIEAQSLL